MEFIDTLKPFTLIAYYILVSLVVLLVILDNKRPEKSLTFILLIMLFPLACMLIYFLFGAQYQRKRLFTKKRYFDKLFYQQIKPSTKPYSLEDLEQRMKVSVVGWSKGDQRSSLFTGRSLRQEQAKQSSTSQSNLPIRHFQDP